MTYGTGQLGNPTGRSGLNPVGKMGNPKGGFVGLKNINNQIDNNVGINTPLGNNNEPENKNEYDLNSDMWQPKTLQTKQEGANYAGGNLYQNLVNPIKSFDSFLKTKLQEKESKGIDNLVEEYKGYKLYKGNEGMYFIGKDKQKHNVKDTKEFKGTVDFYNKPQNDFNAPLVLKSSEFYGGYNPKTGLGTTNYGMGSTTQTSSFDKELEGKSDIEKQQILSNRQLDKQLIDIKSEPYSELGKETAILGASMAIPGGVSKLVGTLAKGANKAAGTVVSKFLELTKAPIVKPGTISKATNIIKNIPQKSGYAGRVVGPSYDEIVNTAKKGLDLYNKIAPTVAITASGVPQQAVGILSKDYALKLNDIIPQTAGMREDNKKFIEGMGKGGANTAIQVYGVIENALTAKYFPNLTNATTAISTTDMGKDILGALGEVPQIGGKILAEAIIPQEQLNKLGEQERMQLYAMAFSAGKTLTDNITSKTMEGGKYFDLGKQEKYNEVMDKTAPEQKQEIITRANELYDKNIIPKQENIAKKEGDIKYQQLKEREEGLNIRETKLKELENIRQQKEILLGNKKINEQQKKQQLIDLENKRKEILRGGKESDLELSKEGLDISKRKQEYNNKINEVDTELSNYKQNIKDTNLKKEIENIEKDIQQKKQYESNIELGKENITNDFKKFKEPYQKAKKEYGEYLDKNGIQTIGKDNKDFQKDYEGLRNDIQKISKEYGTDISINEKLIVSPDGEVINKTNKQGEPIMESEVNYSTNDKSGKNLGSILKKIDKDIENGDIDIRDLRQIKSQIGALEYKDRTSEGLKQNIYRTINDIIENYTSNDFKKLNKQYASIVDDFGIIEKKYIRKENGWDKGLNQNIENIITDIFEGKNSDNLQQSLKKSLGTNEFNNIKSYYENIRGLKSIGKQTIEDKLNNLKTKSSQDKGLQNIINKRLDTEKQYKQSIENDRLALKELKLEKKVEIQERLNKIYDEYIDTKTTKNILNNEISNINKKINEQKTDTRNEASINMLNYQRKKLQEAYNREGKKEDIKLLKDDLAEHERIHNEFNNKLSNITPENFNKGMNSLADLLDTNVKEKGKIGRTFREYLNDLESNRDVKTTDLVDLMGKANVGKIQEGFRTVGSLSGIRVYAGNFISNLSNIAKIMSYRYGKTRQGYDDKTKMGKVLETLKGGRFGNITSLLQDQTMKNNANQETENSNLIYKTNEEENNEETNEKYKNIEATLKKKQEEKNKIIQKMKDKFKNK